MKATPKRDLQQLAALLAHVPLCFSDRVEKARLLAPILRQTMVITGRKEVSISDSTLYPTLIPLITPQIVTELKGFRHADQVHIDGLEPIFGKGRVDWRLLLALEAGYDKRAKAYLDWLLSKAAEEYDDRELLLFAKAIAPIKRRGFAQPDKARATLYMLQRRVEGSPVKEGEEIVSVLTGNSSGQAYENKVRNMNRVLSGAVLGKFGRKEGRPKKTPQRKLQG